MTTEASLDTSRLPRQVRERMQRIQAAREAKPSDGSDATPPTADATPPVVTEPDAPSSAPAPAADPRENDPTYWKQRFQVTEGMLRKARDDAREAAAARDLELTELRSRIRSLEEGKAQDSKPDVALFFTPEQIEQFGADQCEAMANAALKAAKVELQSAIDAEIKPIKDRATADAKQAQADKEAKFFDALTEAVPDWETVNADQAWLDWLKLDDSTTGYQRQKILDDHHAALNAAKVAKLFADFKASRARPAPPVAAPRAAGAGGGEHPAANLPAKGYPDSKEIKDYYKRASIGKVTDKERVEFEARLRSRAAA